MVSFSPHRASPYDTSSRVRLAVNNEVARPLPCRSDESLQSPVPLQYREGLSVSLHIEALRDLSCDSSNTFTGRPLSLVLCILAHASVFSVLAFASVLAVCVLLCSRDLEDVLSSLCPARDPRAVPDGVRFDPHVLHPQHCRTGLGVVVKSPTIDSRARVFRTLPTFVGTSSLSW